MVGKRLPGFGCIVLDVVTLGSSSIFKVKSKGQDIYTKEIDNARLGVEFFLEMYRKIAVLDDAIMIKGAKDVAYLPLKISFDEIFAKAES